MMLVNIYWNKKNGDAIVPTVVKTEAGYWLDVEPVGHASINDAISLIAAAKSALSRSGKIVTTPSGRNFPKPVVLAHAEANSLNDFERIYDMLSIVQSSEGIYSVQRYREVKEETGRVVDIDKSITYPADVTLDEILNRLVNLIS